MVFLQEGNEISHIENIGLASDCQVNSPHRQYEYTLHFLAHDEIICEYIAHWLIKTPDARCDIVPIESLFRHTVPFILNVFFFFIYRHFAKQIIFPAWADLFSCHVSDVTNLLNSFTRKKKNLRTQYVTNRPKNIWIWTNVICVLQLAHV